jgi:hypothetical protein
VKVIHNDNKFWYVFYDTADIDPSTGNWSHKLSASEAKQVRKQMDLKRNNQHFTVNILRDFSDFVVKCEMKSQKWEMVCGGFLNSRCQWQMMDDTEDESEVECVIEKVQFRELVLKYIGDNSLSYRNRSFFADTKKQRIIPIPSHLNTDSLKCAYRHRKQKTWVQECTGDKIKLHEVNRLLFPFGLEDLTMDSSDDDDSSVSDSDSDDNSDSSDTDYDSGRGYGVVRIPGIPQFTSVFKNEQRKSKSSRKSTNNHRRFDVGLEYKRRMGKIQTICKIFTIPEYC